MREYRGKRLDNGEWAYGYIQFNKDKSLAWVCESKEDDWTVKNQFPVDHETVGQYTGKKDEEKNEIFDGDKLFAPGNLDDDLQYVGTVVWDDDDNRWEVTSFYGRFEWIPDGCVVRGTKFDNQDLLGEVRE